MKKKLFEALSIDLHSRRGGSDYVTRRTQERSQQTYCCKIISNTSNVLSNLDGLMMIVCSVRRMRLNVTSLGGKRGGVGKALASTLNEVNYLSTVLEIKK